MFVVVVETPYAILTDEFVPLRSVEGCLTPKHTSTIEELIELGLGGFEIDHRENTPEGQRVLSALAEKHDLIVTGSSDYHGSGKPNLPGENTTTDKNVARIIAQATGIEPVYPD